MANKRNLKKSIRRMCGAIAGECVLANDYIEGVDVNKLGRALVSVANLQESTLSMVTLAFEKGPRDFESVMAYRKARAAYFRSAYAKLAKDFEERVNAIIAVMNEALPAKVK